jgi:hypothetical protein
MHARVLVFLMVIAAAPPALALDACFADSVGSWRGPVWNGTGLQTMDTTFQLGSDGALAGRYRIHDFVPFDGTLTELRKTGDCAADFTWHDRDGTGVVNIHFEPELGRFLGRWGTTDPRPELEFNGYRTGPKPIS